MRCFFCGSDQSQVIDKRAVKTTGEIRRRRECLKCHNRFTTYEKVCALELMVVKRDGRKQLYDRSKLKRGIEKALEKRPAFDQVDVIVGVIEKKLWVKGRNQVESKLVGAAVLTELKKADQVAYLRFASVYRNFANTTDFAKELQSLEEKRVAKVV
jgi:transcriptional repressor NrdR